MKLPSLKQAFAIHFSISLVIFIVLVALMMRYWFPGDLFFMEGGWQGLKLIAPIDLILGPALTLLLYRPWKKFLAFDMSVIAAVQLIALGYGVHSAYQQRTAAIVFSEHRFETVSISEFKTAQKYLLENDLPAKPLSEFGSMPIVVMAETFDAEAYGKYLESIINGGPELRERSDRYRPIDTTHERIAKFRLDTDPDTEENGTTIEVPASSHTKQPRTGTDIFPIKGRFSNGTITFNGEDYKIERNGS